MEKIFLFDVDGTLTPSRQKMDDAFSDFFLRFVFENPTYLVTGSDFDKTLEQVGYQIIFSCRKTFHCSGNECRNQANIIYKNEWNPKPELLEELEEMIYSDPYDIRTGKHIELRTGSLNFSILGRNANLAQRKHYKIYDEIIDHRASLVKKLSVKYPELSFQIGGETGLDIFPKGYDKSQILDHLPNSEIYFFGDSMHESGNDFPILKSLAMCGRPGLTFHVKDWKDTMNILQKVYT